MTTKTASEAQLTINFEEGLSQRHCSIRDVVAAGVYQRGLKRVAGDLDMAPSNLSTQLSDDPSRHFSVDSLERYIEKTGDTRVIEYLIDKFMADKSRNAEAMLGNLQKQLASLTNEVIALRGRMA